ncbi:MAG: DUF2760 domain-containing protein [Polyangiaceae bacterium]
MEEHADLEITLALNYLSRGASQNAIDVMKRLLSREPEHAVAHSVLAEALLKQRRLHAALHEAELGLSLSPEEPLCHRVLAAVAVAHNQLGKAREHAEQARSLSPEDPGSCMQLASIELLDGRPAKALEYALLARELAPDDADAISCVAQAQFARGELGLAEQAAREALELMPEHADSLITMGELLLRRGELGAAREHAVSVLYSAPDHQGALQLLVSIKARQRFWLGLWWRANSWLTLRPGRAIFVLVLAYLLQRVLVTWTHVEGHRMASEIVAYSWLGLCIYSWVAPGIYQRALRKELEVVQLRPDFLREIRGLGLLADHRLARVTAPPSFVARLWLCWVCFFRVLFDAKFAARLLEMDSAPAELTPAAPPAPVVQPNPEPAESAVDGALQLLTLFQREGRLVDFLQQDVSAFGDADVGAAARVVHDGCRRALKAHAEVAPLRSEAEGSSVAVSAEQVKEVKLTGNVAGSAPYRGVLRHRGWRVASLRLPARVGEHDSSLVAAAEVEL